MTEVSERHRKLAAQRKAERRAAKAKIPKPRCDQCEEVIAKPRRLAAPGRWARAYCSNACRQAAWRNRHGE